MLESTENLKHKATLSLLYGGGLRPSELLNLKLEDIDSHKSYIHQRIERKIKQTVGHILLAFSPKDIIKNVRREGYFLTVRI